MAKKGQVFKQATYYVRCPTCSNKIEVDEGDSGEINCDVFFCQGSVSYDNSYDFDSIDEN